MRLLPLALLLLFAGCAGMLTGGPLITDPNAPTSQIIVQNQSGYEVTAVLISACSASTYGLNRLPRGTSIPPGASYSFTVTSGCWDVLAGGSGAEARQRMEVYGQGTVYTVTN